MLLRRDIARFGFGNRRRLCSYTKEYYDYDLGKKGTYKCPDEEYSEGLCKFHHKGYAANENNKKELIELLKLKIADANELQSPLIWFGYQIPPGFAIRSEFKTNVYLDGSNFLGDAAFIESTFERDASFSKVHFNGKADFCNAHFNGEARFYEAQFNGEARFSKAQFNGKAVSFFNAQFKEEQQLADFSNVKFNGETNFSRAHFNGEAHFFNTQFKQASFYEAHFNGEVRFMSPPLYGTHFNGKADFRYAHFNGEAHFSNLKFNGEADFDEAQFNGKAAYFSGAQFKHASFSKVQFNGEAAYFSYAQFKHASFSKAQFNGKAHFYKADFYKATFSYAHFNREADFFNAQFKEEQQLADFSNVKFNGEARFSKAQFNGEADFDEAQFKHASFNGAFFNGDANFNTQFKDLASFNRAHFNRNASFGAFFHADFSGAIFNGETNFIGSFDGKASFVATTFNGKAYFKETEFNTGADFDSATFNGEALLPIKGNFIFTYVLLKDQAKVFFNGDLSKVSFANTDITRVRFGDKVQWGRKKSNSGNGESEEEVDFKIYDERLIEEFVKKKNNELTNLLTNSLEAVIAEYRNLRENYEYNLRYEEAGQFFIREMELRRKYKQKSSSSSVADNKIEKKNIFERIFSFAALYYYVSDYGESTRKPLAITVFTFALGTLYFWYLKGLSMDTASVSESIKRTLEAFFPFFNLPEDSGLAEMILKVTALALAGLFLITLRRKLERRFRH
jgi:uncharacterized protein YjbI with pentapeptide repeats